jgi:molybdopterin-guanine dinucleotide biosynthesis protein A
MNSAAPAGFILTGGASRRMGRTKSLLPFRGHTLVEHIARQMAGCTGSVTLVGFPSVHESLGLPVIADDYPGAGPLGGIITALRKTRSDWNLIVACDMPLLTPEVFDKLIRAISRQDRCVLPATPDGKLQPLCGLYHVAARSELERLFGEGVRRLQDAARELDPLIVPMPDPAWATNVNTGSEWQKLER